MRRFSLPKKQVRTFSGFDELDFSGKRLIPFCTHGGSGLSRTVQTITRFESGAKGERNTLSIYRDDIADAEKRVDAWLKEISAER